jgi:hypothetical protein
MRAVVATVDPYRREHDHDHDADERDGAPRLDRLLVSWWAPPP